MEKIANLTQHNSTIDQQKVGVVDLVEMQNEIRELLTFDEIPTKNEMEERAFRLAQIVKEQGVFEKAMIGGAPFFMSTLEKVLKENGIQPVYAFSKRVSIETEENGKIVKRSVFKFEGFVEV
jgi:hypothetical protein